jgi:hypothetical protein
MVAWLDRLLGRNRERDDGDTRPMMMTTGLDPWQMVERANAQPERPSSPRAPVAVAEPVTSLITGEPLAFSVWERLADDPNAQDLRARWESRWDEF